MNRTTMILVFLVGIGFQSTAARAQITWHVECGDCADCPDPPGCLKADTFCSIQHAIDCASNGDEIIVAPGTCCETINFLDRSIIVRSSGGPNVTTIDAGGSGNVVTCEGGQGPDTVLDGFTITGGNATDGGGMLNNGSSPTVTNCTFSGNNASNAGGGMYNQNSAPEVLNCMFIDNWATGGAGMMNETASAPLVRNCKFLGNAAPDGGGGGMANWDDESSPSVINCLFSGNSAGTGGAIRNGQGASPSFTNCTFSGNSATANGGGIAHSNGGVAISNCIVWGSVDDSDGDSGGPYTDESAQIHVFSGSVVVYYSCIQGLIPSGGFGNGTNIGDEPLFVNADGNDNTVGTDDDNLRLSQGSPCIDAAHNNAVPEGISTDLDGNPRIVDGDCDGDTIVDMGAYEFQQSCTPCPADLNSDGVVDAFDLAILLGSWGPCCGDGICINDPKDNNNETCDASNPDYICEQDCGACP